MPHPRRIEGVILALFPKMACSRMQAGIMPDQLKFEANQRFFGRGLDGVDVVVHGRHSHERQRHSDTRRRLILTRQVLAIADDHRIREALFLELPGASLWSKPWLLGWGRQTAALSSLAASQECSDCFWTVMTCSTCPVHPRWPLLPGGRPVSRGAPRDLRKGVLVDYGLEAEARGSH